jgi:mono/diheme cytochrome c family protein
MIHARMSRPRKLLAISCAVIGVAGLTSACGTEKIKVAKSSGPLYTGAVLFNQRCSGCHTLSYAATHGSAANVRSSQFNNGPNFDVRCERPVTRVLYAIANGGFSGAIMPQNVVVGQDAVDVAKFVATYSGRKAPKVPGTIICNQQPIGSIPAAVPAAATTPAKSSTTTTPATTTTTPAKKKKKK